MDVVRWTPSDVARRSPVLIPDELDGAAVLVLDGFGDGDPTPLDWAQRVPCPVIAVAIDPTSIPDTVDIVVPESSVDELTGRATVAPRAAHLLVDVLRTIEGLDVDRGLSVESLAYSTLLASAEFQTWLDSSPARSPRTFAGPAVRSERMNDEFHVTLARPENRNAFSAQLRDELHEALTSAALDPSISRVVVAADGPVFSSGGDLAEFGSADDVARAHEIRTLRSVGAALAGLPVPVTARVQGSCVGAGVELAAFANEVIADPETTFRLPEIEMGLIPGAGGTVSLTRRIGRQRTGELALSGRAMSCDEAHAVGLVDRILVADR